MVLRRKTRGAQSTLEYSILILCVATALVAMGHYIKRGLSGGLRTSAEELQEHFDPLNNTYNITTIDNGTQLVVSRLVTHDFNKDTVVNALKETATETVFFISSVGGQLPPPPSATGITKLAFITPRQTINAGSISQPMTVQLQDGFNNPKIVFSDIQIDLISSSATGKFYYDVGGTNQITSVIIPAASNSASFYYKDTTAGHPTIRASESPSLGWQDATQTETINAGPIAKLVFITPAQTMDAGILSGEMRIQTQDAFDNPSVVSADTTINLISDSITGSFYSDAGGIKQINSVIIPNRSNLASFYYKDTTAGHPTITAYEVPSLGWSDAIQTETINAGPIAKLAFTTPPRTMDAGIVSAIMRIQTQDAFGNPKAVSANTSINLTSNSAMGKFSSDALGTNQIPAVTIPGGSNTASFYYKDTTAGSPTIRASESPAAVPDWQDATQTETVNDPIAKIAFTTPPRTMDAGIVSGIMTIQTQDASGMPKDVYFHTRIDLSSSSSQGSFSSDALGNSQIFSVIIPDGSDLASFYYKDTTPGNPTITAYESPDRGWANATQRETVNTGIAKLAFTTLPQTINAGSMSGVMTIQTQNASGTARIVLGDTTINLSSSSGQGKFYSDAAGINQINSVIIPDGSNLASFYYKDTTAGSPTIRASESPKQGWQDATQIETVNAGPIVKLVFTTNPQTIDAGILSGVMTIQAQDTFDNPKNVVENTTIALNSTSGTGKFYNASDTETSSVTILNGQSEASFRYQDTTPGNPTITAAESPSASPDWTNATQPVTVRAGNITKLVFTTTAQTIEPGNVSGVMRIQTRDAFDNPSNVSANTTINLTSTSVTGKFYSDALGTNQIPAVTIPGGSNTASFYYKDTTAGSPTIRASESPSQNWQDATQTETINGIARIIFTTPPQTIAVGNVSAIMTIQTQDYFGNLRPVTANTTINLTSTSGTGTFYHDPAGNNLIKADNPLIIPDGRDFASFYYKDTAICEPMLRAAESPAAVPDWQDATQAETINTGITKIVFTTLPQTIEVNRVSAIMRIQTQNASGTPKNVFSDTQINLTCNPATGLFYSDALGNSQIFSVIIPDGSDSASFYFKGTALGQPTITADEFPSQGWAYATQTETVNAPSITKLVFKPSSLAIDAGAMSGAITIEAQDTSGNVQPVSGNTPINLTSTSGQGKFYRNAAGTDQLDNATDPLVIQSNTSSAVFYYQDTTVGAQTITGSAVGKAWTNAKGTITVNIPPIKKLVFTTPPQTFFASDRPVSGGGISGIITVQAQDAYGNPRNVLGNTVIRLTSRSTGSFYSSPGADIRIFFVVIPDGKNSASFYYRDTSPGIATITADEYPDKGWAPATQTEILIIGGIKRLRFITPIRAVVPRGITDIITVQTQDNYGNPINVFDSTVIQLGTYVLPGNPDTGIFYSDSGGSKKTTSVTIQAGFNSASFYYSNSVAKVWAIFAANPNNDGWLAFQDVRVTNGMAKLVFTTLPQTITAGTISGRMTVQARNALNAPVNAPSNTSIALVQRDPLEGNTATYFHTFYKDAAGTIPATNVIMDAGTNQVSFWYRCNSVGNFIIEAVASTVDPTVPATQEVKVTAGASMPAACLVFTTPPRTVAVGQRSEIMTIQTFDVFGNSANVIANTNVRLSSTSNGGKFYNAAGTQITSVTIPGGSNSASFYYQDANVGNPYLVVIGMPVWSVGLGRGLQQETVTAS